MRCISPLLVRTSGRRDFVPCGKCNFCLQVKRADWSFRLEQELKRVKTATFLTLTYDPGNCPINTSGVPVLNKRDLQLFQKRLRKENRKACDWPIRYYSVGEYGSITMRPHYHSIMCNVHPDISARFSDIWSLGMVHTGDVNPASIHYVTKYVINRTEDYAGREPPFSFMSKRPGLGSDYLRTHTGWHKDDLRNYTQVNGITRRLPRYYKDKIFTDYEKQKMAQRAIEQSDEAYVNEIRTLSKFHQDPYHYYEERLTQAHTMIKSKLNQNSKF